MLYPPEGETLPTAYKAVRVPGQVELVEKISPLEGFDPGTVQHVARRHTD